MNAERYLPVARALTVGVVALAIVGLVSWYFYIGRAQSTIQEVSTGRGFGSDIPTFDAPGGSTFGNLLGTLPVVSSAEGARVRPRLSQIHAAPVSGFRLSSTTVQYMDRSGYLFTADLTRDIVARTTNTLIPRVYHAILGDDALLGFAFDDGGDAEAFIGVLESSTSSSGLPTITTRPLGSAVHAARASGGKLLTLVEEPGGGASLIESEFDSSAPRLLTRSEIASWNIATAPGRILLVEQSATGIESSAYELRNGVRELVLRDVPGLTLLPRASSTYVIYGSDTGILSLFAQGDGTTQELSVKTIADKCVWAPEDTENPLAYCAVPGSITTRRFLDEWYRGEVHTQDDWWRVDSSDGSAKPLFSPADGLVFDVYNPQVDPSGRYIVFQNKYDETLWALRITE